MASASDGRHDDPTAPGLGLEAGNGLADEVPVIAMLLDW